jgi:acetyltransferase
MNVIATRARATGDGPVRASRHPGVSIRPIEASDAGDLSDFYAALSDESRRRRFLGTLRGITHAQASAFAGVDHGVSDGFVAVVNEAGPDDGRIVGHVCLFPDGERENEVAVAVADAFQGRGIGRQLMTAAVDSARRRHVPALTLSLFADNAVMRRLALGAGLPCRALPPNCGVAGFRLEVGP